MLQTISSKQALVMFFVPTSSLEAKFTNHKTRGAESLVIITRQGVVFMVFMKSQKWQNMATYCDNVLTWLMKKVSAEKTYLPSVHCPVHNTDSIIIKGCSVNVCYMVDGFLLDMFKWYTKNTKLFNRC